MISHKLSSLICFAVYLHLLTLFETNQLLMNVLNLSIVSHLYRSNYLFFTLGVFAGAFILTYYLIPKIIHVVKEKKLLKQANMRDAHTQATPSFGGVAFYVTFILIVTGLQVIGNKVIGASLIAAVTVLFMVGLKDDLIVSSARVKLFGQLAATAILVFSPALRITDLYGFLGIHEIPAAVGYLFAAFITISLINAYNLIDGINGLAGGIGFIIAMSYAVIFYFTGQTFFVIISVTVAGILLAFLRFNMASLEKRIFMGDSGSLVIGLILSFLTIRLLAIPTSTMHGMIGSLLNYRVLLVLAFLFIPSLDTARIIVYRLAQHRKIYSPDRNHMHHILLDKGCSHPKASFILGGINIFVILVIVGLIFLFPQAPVLLHVSLFVLYSAFWFGAYCLKRKRRSRAEKGVVRLPVFSQRKTSSK